MQRERQSAERSLVRRAFRGAWSGATPDLGRLAERMPEIMAAARRRRSGRSEDDPFAAIFRLGRRAIPGLAALAAALVVATLLVPTGSTKSTASRGYGIESLILTGELGNASEDPLLSVIVEPEGDDG